MAPPALADTVNAPSGVNVMFTGWSAGQSELSVAWTPQPQADGYEVAYAAGTNAPSSPGGGIDVPGASAGSASFALSYGGGPLSVSVWAYTGSSGSNVTALSAPTSVTYAVPGAPVVTATPVSGVVGAAAVSWSAPTLPGDTVVVRGGAGATDGPTGGVAVPLAAGQTTASVTGLPNFSPSNAGYRVAVYELRDGNPDDWSPASTTLAYAAPGPETFVTPSQTYDATHLTVNWTPASCSVVVASQICNYAVLVENPGTKVAVSPSDGTLETAATGTPNGTGAHVSDVVPGQVYTFTVFDVATIRDVEYWSAADSETLRDTALPNMTLTSSTGSTATADETVTLTAKLTTIGTTPTGSVTFRTAKGVLCNAVAVTTSHTAQCRVSAAVVGAQLAANPALGPTVVAVYSGDDVDSSNAVELPLAVQPITPSVTSRVVGPHTRRASVTVAVAGGAGPGTGTGKMSSGSHVLCVKSLSRGSAKCVATTTALGSGKHAITVHYAGSSSYRAKTVKVVVKLAR
jgi:hypothetical protein